MVELKKRILSAIVLVAIVVPLLMLGGIPYSLSVGLIGCIAFKELCDLKKEKNNELPLVVRVIALVGTLSLIYCNFEENSFFYGISYRILCALITLIFVPIVFYKEKYTINNAFELLSKVLFLGIGFNLLISIYNYNISYFILLILITTLTDTFALFGGSLIGKHKFTSISPNKTIEGCLVGSLVSTFVCTVYYINIINSTKNILVVIILILLLSIVGQIGDLFFSAIKREYKIKDFSNLIPGHGGILDRLDSLLFVLYAFSVVFVYL